MHDCLSNRSWKRICCLKICHLSREERLFAEARADLKNEIDVIKFLKKIRRFEAFQREVTNLLDFDS